MPALKMMDIDGTTVIAIEDPRIVAGMKAFGYVWQELDQHSERANLVVDNLDRLYRTLAALTEDKKPAGTDSKPG